MGCGAGREALYPASTQTEPAAPGAAMIEATDSVSIPRLLVEQVQWPLSLIDTTKGGYKKLSGTIRSLIDSGASCHMTSDLKIMEEAKKI